MMRRRLWPRLPVLAVCLLEGACLVGPNHVKPALPVPETFRGASVAGPAALADARWWDVFADEQLQALVRTATTGNYDVRIAAARIEQAEAQVGITRSNQYPSVGLDVQAGGQRTPALGTSEARTAAAVLVRGRAAWELDFWGRYRRGTEAARARLLATEWGQRAVMSTLVSRVADGYFTLRALDLELDIARRTLASRRESLDLARIREQGGATSLVDVRQAEQLVYSAAGTIAEFERRVEQQENFLSVLLGGFPGPVARGRELTAQPHAPEVPAGLPSALLERRPDIQAAEQEIIAANAEIGVARAAYFPSITLTGMGGLQSTALGALFSGGAVGWTAAAGLAQPLFTGGRTRSQVAFAEAARTEATLAYERTVKQAFLEVSDALVGYRKAQEFRAQQELLVDAAQDGRRLADIRYRGGATSYLEVLDAETRLFNAELSLADARLSELADFVELYRALGGGWEKQ
ncbi:MAG: outer membrane protein multidrug efflux system [Acidobacteriota bacterium]